MSPNSKVNSLRSSKSVKESSSSQQVSTSRILIPGVGGIVAVLEDKSASVTVDAQRRKFGLWLSQHVLPLQALPLITQQNTIDILIQLDPKVMRKRLKSPANVPFLAHR